MKISGEFDILNSPRKGTNLIEASAGTGKTYAIAGLALQLLLEHKLPITKILVVTFTEAATNELKGRIRRRLREALACFAKGGSSDPLLEALCRRRPNAGEASRHLQEALYDFDQAPIFTIHGFCMRVLRDQAFESGMMFDAQLVTDQETLVREIVHDFWREHFYRASFLFTNYACAQGITPGSFHALVSKNLTNPYLKIVPQQGIPDCSELEAAFRAHFEAAREVWRSARDEVGHLLLTSNDLNRNRYRKESIPTWVEAMDGFFAAEGRECALPAAFEKFTTGVIRAAVKMKGSPPQHPFFDSCEALRESQLQLTAGFDQALVGLRLAFIHTVRRELTRRKLDKNTLFYDDLLLLLERALRGPGGEQLAAVVRDRYQAALIDEFQDTDAVQYAIFEKIFGQGKRPLFLIGDPKQAIYGFRGADIFAYMKASRQASASFTLGQNWRSEPALIRAVNAVFSHAQKAFIYDEIAFRSVVAAPNKHHEALLVAGKPTPPLQIWIMEAAKLAEGRPITRAIAEELVPGAVAGEIAGLLGGKGRHQTTLGKRPIRPGDLAVLVRRNAEARLVWEALAERGIHAVLYDMGNLFATDEALAVERLLAALAEPSAAGLVKLALTTEIMGVNGVELDRLIRDEAAWETWLIRFGEYHELWTHYGFFRMFRRLLRQEAVLPRLMSLVQGERRCTNILHLAEVLHQAAVDHHLGMAGLVKWLAAQRDPATPPRDEHQLRLESDENAVTIVTIHKSKGMEYPIVFCPFIADRSTLRADDAVLTFHDEADGRRVTLDLGSPEWDEHAKQAQKEQLAENLRLLYVAMTRAKHRCILVWGRFRDAGSSAPAYLFHQPQGAEANALPEAVAARYETLDDKDLWRDLEQLEKRAEGSLALLEIPAAEGERPPVRGEGPVALRCRSFEAGINRDWRISSFSSLISNQPHMADWADRDETAVGDVLNGKQGQEAAAAAGETRDMFSFPRGPAAGIVLHELFEHLDYTERDEAVLGELIAGKLKSHGFEDCWVEPVTTMVRKVLRAPLDSEWGGFRLEQIALTDRLNELEFYFPLQRLSGTRLQAVFAECLGGRGATGFPVNLERLRFQPLEGFMKGFMDLVCRFQDRYYLVDWKSNYLGSNIEDYAQVPLHQAMAEDFYQLQYHLYVVAIHQYLTARLPGYRYESHFGGVYYIFLRGVDPEKGSEYGIYRHRPAASAIGALARNLMGSVAA